MKLYESFFYRQRPRINSSTVDFAKLKDLPENTLGYAYFKFLECNVKYINFAAPNNGNLEYTYICYYYSESNPRFSR